MSLFEDKIVDFIIADQSAKTPELEKELRADPNFDEGLFNTYETIWNLSDSLKDLREADLETNWEDILAETGIKERKPHRTRKIWRVVSIAATVLILIGAGLFYWFTRSDFITHVAATDETFILPDQTAIELKEGTEITYLRPRLFAKADRRDITIEGEGIFDVVSDPQRPFEVTSKLTKVEVLGTNFMYQARGDSSSVFNNRGLVGYGILSSGEVYELEEGEGASFDGKSIKLDTIIPEPPPPPDTTNNIGLSDFLDILSDRFEDRIVLGSNLPQNSQIVVNVNLHLDLEGILNHLDENENVRIGYSPTGGNRFQIYSLDVDDMNLAADYSYEAYISGLPFKRAEDVQ